MKRMLALLLLGSGLAGCVSDTHYLDSKFGPALDEGKAAQTISGTQSTPSAQLGARELRKTIDSYLSGGASTPALQGVTGVGGSSSAK